MPLNSLFITGLVFSAIAIIAGLIRVFQGKVEPKTMISGKGFTSETTGIIPLIFTFGIVLMVLGFFKGDNISELKNKEDKRDSPTPLSKK